MLQLFRRSNVIKPVVLTMSFATFSIGPAAQAAFNSVTCFDISDPGSQGSSVFFVKLSRQSMDPNSSTFITFDAAVSQQVSIAPPHTYETIGRYVVQAEDSSNTQQSLLLFTSEDFRLSLYPTNSLPWAQLWMITNSGMNPNTEITKQLECSLVE